MQEVWICKTEDELPAIAVAILNSVQSKKFALSGELGSGKTTLIKQFCHHLGITDHVSSPSFTILNEYSGNQVKVFHFDFYRINKMDEIFDLGYEEYLYSDEYVFIEWAEKLELLLPEHFVKLKIELKESKARIFQIIY